jgi:hypothetical protein
VRTVATLALGAGAVALASVAGGSDLFGALLQPPAAVRALLAAAAALLGVVLVLRSADGMRESREPADLVRAVRIVFLAVAAFAASAGWFIGSPVPIVAALVIAGVDVLETTFLLLVTAVRRPP